MTDTLGTRLPSMAEILAATSVYYRLQPDDLIGGDTSRYSSIPRQVACYLARQLTAKSLPEIARDVGLKDHTTVLHAERQIYDGMNKCRGTREAVGAIGNLVNHVRSRSWQPMSFGAARNECEDALYAAVCVGRFLRGLA